jgi:thiosulfate dehydrogenase
MQRARRMAWVGWTMLLAGSAGGVALAQGLRHRLPESKNGDLVVGLCDGKTSVTVAGVKDGTPLTHAQGQSVSDALMRQWKDSHPGSAWDSEERLAQLEAPPAGAQPPPAPAGTATPPGAPAAVGPQAPNAQGPAGVPAGVEHPQQQGQTYGAYTRRDEQIWAASTETFVGEGNRIFHDDKALGGTIAVSCDMCHPNAANTHPETYPKYQVQLGRVALLRDMINWCIENPVRGKPLAEDDPKLKALESYILAQRKGTALDYGRH